MIERELENIGLTRGEIAVYLALLKIGSTTTGKIIREAQISSGKIYEILNKLVAKGLVSYIVKEKVKYFRVTSPRSILEYIREKETELKQKERTIEKMLPDLLRLQNSKKNVENAVLYKGLKGIKSAINEALEPLNSDTEILALGVHSDKDEMYNRLWKKWHKERIKKKISCKAIFTDKGTPYYKFFKSVPLTEVRFIESITPASVDVMGNKTLVFTYGDNPSCLVITNDEVAKSFTEFFKSLWSMAKS